MPISAKEKSFTKSEDEKNSESNSLDTTLQSSKVFAYYLGPTIVVAVANVLLLLPIRTYYLDQSDFGVYALIMTFVGFLGPLAATGGAWVLSAHYYQLQNVERKELLFNQIAIDLSVKAFWVFVFWFAGPNLLRLTIPSFHENWITFLRVALLGELLNCLWPTVSYHMVLNRRPKFHAVYQLAVFVVAGITTVGLLHWRGAGLLSLFIGVTAGNAIAMLLCVLYLRGHCKFLLSRRWIWVGIKAGLPAMPGGMTESGLGLVERYLLERFTGLASLGIYAHSQLYKSLFQQASKAFAKTIAPSFLRAYQLNSAADNCFKIYNLWVAGMALGGVVLIAFGKKAISILTHGKFTEAAPIVLAWYMCALLMIQQLPGMQLLLARGHARMIAAIQVYSSLITVPLLYFGVKFYGVLGASAVVVLAMVFVNIMLRAKTRDSTCRSAVGSDADIAIYSYAALLFAFCLSEEYQLHWILPVLCIAMALLWGKKVYRGLSDDGLDPYLKKL